MSSIHAISTQNINPLTDFLRNSKAHIARLKETRAPEVLTVNGKAEVVVLDASSYQELLDKVEQAELIESLREAIAEMDAGKGIPLETLKTELDERYGI